MFENSGLHIFSSSNSLPVSPLPYSSWVTQDTWVHSDQVLLTTRCPQHLFSLPPTKPSLPTLLQGLSVLLEGKPQISGSAGGPHAMTSMSLRFGEVPSILTIPLDKS